MFDYDAIVIGGGPAGLSAGIYLTRAGYRVLLLEKESFGGQLKNMERIENYPGFARGVSGADLASEMIEQAAICGVEMEPGEVVGIDAFSSCKSVACADGKGYTCSVVIVASGSRAKRLGVPGEEAFGATGVIHCALCDGDRFTGGVVAVCGGGDAGVTEALYLARLASKVILIEAQPCLTASAILRERAQAHQGIEIRCGQRVVGITGDAALRALDLSDPITGQTERVPVDGVLVHVGVEPNTAWLEGLVGLDDERRVMVDHQLQTDHPGVFAAGDVRSGSPCQVASAVGDGAVAAVAAQRVLQLLDPEA
jgi:thioredoxin reductase (NADPH)